MKLALPTLHDLATKYACDKLFFHSYIPFYEGLFCARPVRRLLEIGIGYEDLMKPLVPEYIHGASLRMWQDYFPYAHIYACDIRPDTLINEGRIHSKVCDQRKVADLRSLRLWVHNDLDVIIDDGSHDTSDQILTAITLLPYVTSGGVYVVEDVMEPEKVAAAIGGVVVKFPKRCDDNLVVVVRR